VREIYDLGQTLLIGDRILVNKILYGLRMPDSVFGLQVPGLPYGQYLFHAAAVRRGDVVVFKAPTQPDKDFIKRIIGLPGDTVLVKNGQVLINGTPLDETYIHYSATYTYPFDGQPKPVPDGNYFVLGDNRPNSSDQSRTASNSRARAWTGSSPWSGRRLA